jgi:hypothetical protein
MPKTSPSLRVRTRIPLAAWALAAVVAIYSVMSSVLQAAPQDHAMPRAEQADRPANHQAKV